MLAELFATELRKEWWLEPAIATISFTSAILFFNLLERNPVKLALGSLKDGDGFVFFAQVAVAYLGGLGVLWARLVNVQERSSRLPDWPSLKNDESWLSGWGLEDHHVKLCLLVTEVAFGIFLYDFVMFWAHWAFHAMPFIKRLFNHTKHHEQFENNSDGSFRVRAFHVVHHSLVDGSMQVLANILVQNCNCFPGIPKSRASRWLHNIVVTWMLTESHTDSDVSIFRRWFVGLRDHHAHHTFYGDVRRTRYQQFFGYLDEARWWLTGIEGFKPAESTARPLSGKTLKHKVATETQQPAN